MRKISISPSLLDSYRVTQAGLFGKTGDDLANDIIGKREPTEAMSRGTAYHRLIEEGGQKFYKEIPNGKYVSFSDDSGGLLQVPEKHIEYHVPEIELQKIWTFSEQAAAPALKTRADYPNMLHEMKARHTLKLRGFEVEMRMRLDGVDGITVHEFKTKNRAPAMMEYYNALQWRCYLLPFPEIQAVKYTIFHLNDMNTTCTPHTFTFEREDGNEGCVMAYMNGFLQWLEMRPELLDHLEQKALRPDYE
jgi:hypothetical protein